MDRKDEPARDGRWSLPASWTGQPVVAPVVSVAAICIETKHSMVFGHQATLSHAASESGPGLFGSLTLVQLGEPAELGATYRVTITREG